MEFELYPFEKLNRLLDKIIPDNKYAPCTLTIGEPQFQTPNNIQLELCKNTGLLNKYPKSAGEDYLKSSIIDFVNRRFALKLDKDELIPTFGTREVLFNFPQFLLFDKPKPTMAFTNPFYQIYQGSAIASRASIIYIDLTPKTNFKAKLGDKDLQKCDLVILNFPNNPTGACIDMDELVWWVEKSLEFDFVLINDECYSELYFDDNQKPISLLEACIKVNNTSFKNCIVLNSISKRNSAPGLRSGFICGDRDILAQYIKYRTFVGCAIPLPLQKASSIAWGDSQSASEFRQLYKQNFILAKEILGISIPKATFYIWLWVGDDLSFAKELYKQKNIKVLPGSFLGKNGAGDGYVRIALVEHPTKSKEVLYRLKDFLDDFDC